MAKRSKKTAPTTPTRSRWATPYRLLGGVFCVVVLGTVGYLVLSIMEGGGRPQSIPAGALKRHNLLMITVDTLRADRLGSYGSTGNFTPRLDGMAAEGIRFENVLAHVPTTLPSHSSIFTANYPTQHGVRDNGAFRLEPAWPTLATLLKASHYRTGAFVGAFVLDARFGLNRGFDVYDDYYGEKRDFLSFQQLERPADEVIAPAERWIAEADERPWFAWVHLYDPHKPYAAPSEFRQKFGANPYGAEVAYVDAQIGAFLDRLDQSGALERTLVTVVGDHGESLGEHGELTHGTFAYQSTLRVPWLLWAKATLPPRVFPGLVRHVDVMPTLLDLLGIAPPEKIAGESLRPYLAGERDYDPPFSYFEALNVYLTRDWAPLSGVVGSGHKLIRLPIPELYDLEADPAEQHNLYDQRPRLAAQLEGKLDELALGEVKAASAPDAETLERLRSLGYITAPVAEHKTDYTEEDDPKRLITISNAYDEVADLFARGRLLEAGTMLQDLLRKQPRSSQAYQGLAYALYQMGRVPEAVQVLEKGVAVGILDPALHGLLSAYLLDMGRLQQARELLEELARREPGYVEGRNQLGIAYGRLGLFEQAEQEFETVLELDPGSASTYNNMGSLALSRSDLRGAIELFGKALAYDPAMAKAHNGLGVAHSQLGDPAAAVASWKRAVELDRRQFDALYNLAITLADTSPGDAVRYLEQFAREAPPERYRADIERVRERLGRIRGAGTRGDAAHN